MIPHKARPGLASRTDVKKPETGRALNLVVEHITPPHAHPTENDLTCAPGRAWAYPLTPSASLLCYSHFPTAVRPCPRTWLVAEMPPECRLPSQPGAPQCTRSPSTKSSSPNAGDKPQDITALENGGPRPQLLEVIQTGDLPTGRDPRARRHKMSHHKAIQRTCTAARNEALHLA